MADHPICADDMQEIVESFVVESAELLETLDRDLLRLEQAPGDAALVDQIFRAVHTVKGTSGFLSLEQLSALAHRFEEVLNKLRQGALAFDPAMMDVLLAAADQMRALLQQVADRAVTPLDLSALLSDLAAVSEGTYAPAAEAAAETSPSAAPEPLKPKQPAPAKRQTPKRLSGASETIRVGVGRLDKLMDLVGELVLGRNRLLQLAENAQQRGARRAAAGRLGGGRGGGGHDEAEALLRGLAGAADHVDFVTSELQSAVMQTRMVEIGRVFSKFPRVVRDLAREFGKEIDLVIEGEGTELDKSLVEEIGDPLVHLIRNAADHGIERPAAREAAGKPRQGRVRLSAAHENGHIAIRIEDDGAGLDAEKLKAKALEKGLITAAEAEGLSEAEAYDLIFRPGFSTAQRVSQVSGRGVGMDVVKTNLTKLSGSIRIDSELGAGTCFTLKLPLTLAIIRGLLARVGAETFALPLHAVTEVVRLPPAGVDTIRGREVLRHRDRVLPLLRVGEALGVEREEGGSGPEEKAAGASAEASYAVVVNLAHERLGLVVDRLLAQKEIVIKPLGGYLQDVPGVAGSTILGDGRVVMILDVGELIRLEKEKLRARRSRPAAPPASAAA